MIKIEDEIPNIDRAIDENNGGTSSMMDENVNATRTHKI